MEITLDKNAFVITCNEKRYEMFVKIFNYYNIPLPIKFWGCQAKFNYKVSSIRRLKVERGHCGCLFSHYSLYKIAQALDLPYLIVFEDDAFPRKNILEYFDKSIKNLPENWNFLKLEDTHFDEYVVKKFYNDYWFSGVNLRRGSGTGAYIIKKELYQIIIDIIEHDLLINSSENYIDCIIRVNIELDNEFNKNNGYGHYVSTNPMFLQHNFHNEYHMSHIINSNIRNTNEDDTEMFDTKIFENGIIN